MSMITEVAVTNHPWAWLEVSHSWAEYVGHNHLSAYVSEKGLSLQRCTLEAQPHSGACVA